MPISVFLGGQGLSVVLLDLCETSNILGVLNDALIFLRERNVASEIPSMF